MRKLLRTLFISAVAILIPQNLFAAENSFSQGSLHALDTVANFETVVKVPSAFVGNASTFQIMKPDGTIFKVRGGDIDEGGNVTAMIDGRETHMAGIYRVTVNGMETSFEVFPGEASGVASGLYANKGYVAGNGVDTAKVTVRVVDDFANPLEGHTVKLISSRSGDVIYPVSADTDERGIAYFSISSSETGISILTATDESSDLILPTRLKLVFYRAKGVHRAVGGDPETMFRATDDRLIVQANPSVARFEIDNIPASVVLNETVSFRVSALDASSNVVPSYTGKILFFSTDVNAKYPKQYTFLPADQGRKTFDVVLSFGTVGSQKLIVQDESDGHIKGEKTVSVLVSAGSTGGQVILTKPATGTYSVKTLEIAGEVSPNAKVKIFNNGQQIAEVQAQSTGRFTFNTPLLPDGQHTFHIESNGVTSSPVTVTIDSTPAQIESVELTKTHVAPGEVTQLTIRSEPDLNSIQATVGDFITDLEADPQNPGIYRGNLTAPLQDGEHTVNVIVTDKLGNPSPAAEVGKLIVDASLKTTGAVTFSIPSKVQGLKAFAGNASVKLTWQPASAEAGIAHYRVYYGTDAKKLSLVMNTQDSKTGWTVMNLQNGTVYYFQATAVDTKGSEGDLRSDVASATPSATAGPVLCDPMPCPPDLPIPPTTPEDGPFTLGMLFASLLGGSAIHFLRRKRK